MKIFSRLADLLKANINDLIDRAEDPEKMVKQIIIDMEEQLQRAVQGLGTVMASERQMEKQLDKSKEESAMWEKRAKDALEAGDEELAKKALAKKLEADEDVKQYEEIHEGISKQLSVLRGQVDRWLFLFLGGTDSTAGVRDDGFSLDEVLEQTPQACQTTRSRCRFEATSRQVCHPLAHKLRVQRRLGANDGGTEQPRALTGDRIIALRLCHVVVQRQPERRTRSRGAAARADALLVEIPLRRL